MSRADRASIQKADRPGPFISATAIRAAAPCPTMNVTMAAMAP